MVNHRNDNLFSVFRTILLLERSKKGEVIKIYAVVHPGGAWEGDKSEEYTLKDADADSSDSIPM